MKAFCLIFALAVASVAAGGVTEDATVLTIGTAGPDRYADGATVLDGECYALVWRAKGHAFAGFRADGTVAESAHARVLCLAPLAKGGRCPDTTFVVDSRVLAACGAGGTFGLYLLDSRRWDDKGVATPAGLKGIHGSVLVSETASVDSFVSASAAAPAAFLASALPAGVDAPRITAMRMEGDVAVLTVQSTSAALNYNVAGGGELAASAKGAVAERPVPGAEKPTDSIELRVPCKQFGSHGFFKVVRNPLEASE